MAMLVVGRCRPTQMGVIGRSFATPIGGENDRRENPSMNQPSICNMQCMGGVDSLEWANSQVAMSEEPREAIR